MPDDSKQIAPEPTSRVIIGASDAQALKLQVSKMRREALNIKHEAEAAAMASIAQRAGRFALWSDGFIKLMDKIIEKSSVAGSTPAGMSTVADC